MGKNDHIKERPVRAVVLDSRYVQVDFGNSLPENYDYSKDGVFRFPAGEVGYYVVDGICYGLDLFSSFEQKKEEALRSLAEAGFSESEAEEYLSNLERVKGNEQNLSYDESVKWLELHPEHRQKAFGVLEETVKSIQERG